MPPTHRHPIGILRREFLQVGFSGLLGLSLPELLGLRARAEAASRGGTKSPALQPRAKSVIIVFLTGGLSHIDTFDMKPEAPEGIRGEFKPIDTAVPGFQFCEHLPLLAARADKLAIVRSFAHAYTNHLNATHEILTGHPQPGGFLRQDRLP
jgi:Protein of unknown function (DUF1501)